MKVCESKGLRRKAEVRRSRLDVGRRAPSPGVIFVSAEFRGVADEIPVSVHCNGLRFISSSSDPVRGNFRGGGLWLESLPSGRLAITTLSSGSQSASSIFRLELYHNS